MTRPSDYTQQLCQNLTDDLMALRTVHLEPIRGEAEGHDDPRLERILARVVAADGVVQRILDRVQGFDHSFGRDGESD